MTVHVPVLARQVIESLGIEPGMTVVDATMGGGGHTQLLAERTGPQGIVIAVDRDPMAVVAAQNKFRLGNVRAFTASYVELPALLHSISIDAVDAILLDLGLSSDQLADASRGFSFQSGGELDMRFNPAEGIPAWQLLEELDEKEIADVIYQYGEERFSRRIARNIVAARRHHPIRTADEFAQLVRRSVPRSRGHSIDPATRAFQALRIAVNDELNGLRMATERLPLLLRPGGRIAVISFHSLEDRIVKQAFRSNSELEILTRKPIRAEPDEIRHNARARSARLRVARRRRPEMEAMK